MGNNNIIPSQAEFLDLEHPYFILVPKDKEALNLLYDGHIYSDGNRVSDKLEYMKFNERQYILLEKYLFNFISEKCDLIITMYEEEWAEGDRLKDIVKITKHMLDNCDNEEVIKLANKFLKLVKTAININTSLVFYF